MKLLTFAFSLFVAQSAFAGTVGLKVNKEVYKLHVKNAIMTLSDDSRRLAPAYDVFANVTFGNDCAVAEKKDLVVIKKYRKNKTELKLTQLADYRVCPAVYAPVTKKIKLTTIRTSGTLPKVTLNGKAVSLVKTLVPVVADIDLDFYNLGHLIRVKSVKTRVMPTTDLPVRLARARVTAVATFGNSCQVPRANTLHRLVERDGLRTKISLFQRYEKLDSIRACPAVYRPVDASINVATLNLPIRNLFFVSVNGKTEIYVGPANRN